MGTDIQQGFKVLTQDGRSPLRGGDPVYTGESLPYTLPTVPLDLTSKECGSGWNYTEHLSKAFSIAGMFKRQCFVVEASPDAIERGDKRRASSLTLVRRCSEEKIKQAMQDLVSAWAGKHTEALVEEQWLWYQTLQPVAKPNRTAIEGALREALDARGLQWELREQPHAWAAQAAWDACYAQDTWDAWYAWDARDTWAAWDAWDAWDARDARAAWDAWDAWDARDARAAWNVLDARAALVHWSMTSLSLIKGNPEKLTTGIRTAYREGLVIALPGPENTLNWTCTP